MMDTDALLELMRMQPDTGPEWSTDDFGAILRHQMSLPIETDLENLGADLAVRLADLCTAADPPIGCYAELFAHPDPPLELLEIVKEYAKACRDHVPSPLPPEVATVLYFASIAAAFDCHQASISSLAPGELRAGLSWTRRRAWVDDGTRRVIDAALLRLTI